MPLTPEQIARLPYQETPATSSDVVKEMRNVALLVSSITAVTHSPESATRMLEDPSTRPGQALVIAETRLALALESWGTQLGVEMVDALEQVIGERAPGDGD